MSMAYVLYILWHVLLNLHKAWKLEGYYETITTSGSNVNIIQQIDPQYD